MKRKNKRIWDTSVKYILFIALVPLAIASLLYFNVSSSTRNDMTYEQSSEINKQIILNFENYISNLIDTSDYIESQIEKYDVRDDKQELQLNFKLATELQKDIESIDLYAESGFLILEEIESRPRVVDTETWFINAINNKNVNNFSKALGSYYQVQKEVISLSKYIKYYANGEEQNGVLRIDINFNRINELINITELGEYGAIIFIDEDDSVIYSSADDNSYYKTDEIDGMILGEFTTVIRNNSMFVNINTIANTRWRMVTYLNRNFLTVIKRKDISYFLVILSFSALLAVGLAFRFTRKITRPIEKLKNSLMTVEPRNLHLPINQDDYEEIRVLNESINKMSTRINSLMQFVIQEQEEKAELELDILQHQINPHFLYNTLDTIVVLSENGKKQEVIYTIIALSKYFRINLSGGNKYIPIQLELEQIENYLKIQKVRYQTRFEYDIKVDSSILGYQVLKLLLQPLVENAIYHGTSIYEESQIIISNEMDTSFYYFKVANSGYGLTDEQIDTIHANMRAKSMEKNVGLRNVYSRLKLHYGEESDLYYEVDEESYTIATIKIPLNKLKDIEND